MDSKTLLFAWVLVLSITQPALAQQWLTRLSTAEAAQPTISNLRAAFEKYYREHPVDLAADKLKPTFKFEGAREEEARTSVEQYKLFRRWEWLVVPRSYPEGKLDLDRIAGLREEARLVDEDLDRSQPASFRSEHHHRHNRWKPLGPTDAVGGTNMGRVNCIGFDPKNTHVIYICAADGGVWKSTSGGATWVPKFDFEPTLSVGDIAISRKHTNVVYVATSDSFGYGVPFWGGTYSIGVMKSTNGGDTWKHTNLKWKVSQNRTIRRLVIHPTDDQILMAATSDGLYRTTDGGASWTQILAASAYAVEFDPKNGNLVYATTSQLLKSTNAGASFTALAPSCSGARFNIKIARSNPSVLYTLCTDGTVQKSTDAGATWTTAAGSGVYLYGYYDNVLAVSPVNDKVVYVAGFDIKASSDGGTTWSGVPVAGHVDNHAMEFAPGSGTTLFSGNDGGLFKSVDSGATWSSLNKGLAITQFYRVGVSRTNPNIMVAGAQDNGNMKYASGIFTNITNADGMKGFIDWSNSSVIYAAIQNGDFYRSNDGGLTFMNVNTPASGAWLSPWCQDPAAANTIYAATDKVYKSINQGTTWVPASGSLAGISEFAVLKVSQSNSNVIYAGSGTRLYRTTNGGASWTDITAGLPVATNYLTDMAINDSNPDHAYVTFSGYVAGEKVYQTPDGGATWTNISGTLPNMPVDTIAYEKSVKNGLYIGTDAGVYYRNDNLANWIPYKAGLPNVIVDELEIHYGAKKIRAATYGRGLWEAPLL